jgi:hypothetical protein
MKFGLGFTNIYSMYDPATRLSFVCYYTYCLIVNPSSSAAKKKRFIPFCRPCSFVAAPESTYSLSKWGHHPRTAFVYFDGLTRSLLFLTKGAFFLSSFVFPVLMMASACWRRCSGSAEERASRTTDAAASTIDGKCRAAQQGRVGATQL